MKVGFIGVGNMGCALASRLIGKIPLTVFDKDTKRLDVWDQEGVTVAKDLRDLALGSEVVLTCLPTSNEVKSIVLGKNGISSYLFGSFLARYRINR